MRDDAELLAAWRAGERAAGEALLTRHFDAVHRFFHFKVPEDAAADLIQQTFLAICEGRERFRGDSAFRTYLLGTARLILLTYFRKRRRDLDHVDPLEQSVAEIGPSPSYAITRRREEEILVQALRELPIDLQIAFELYHLEGMTAGELAKLHGLSEPGMYGRLRKARLLVEAACARLAETPALRQATTERLDEWVRGLQARIRGEA